MWGSIEGSSIGVIQGNAGSSDYSSCKWRSRSEAEVLKGLRFRVQRTKPRGF